MRSLIRHSATSARDVVALRRPGVLVLIDPRQFRFVIASKPQRSIRVDALVVRFRSKILIVIPIVF